MGVRWLADVRADDVESVGGKAASLGELTAAGLPVPPGFAVTAGAYRKFLQATGIEDELEAVVHAETPAVDETADAGEEPGSDRNGFAEDPAALADAAERAQTLIREAEFPESLREELLAAYDELGDDPFVAVRSSATAEDQPDASFAGQQETFLNVERDGLVDAVRECWASLFTQRAIYYRGEQGYPLADVDIAVVVQRMVDADKSGVLFTSHPSTGDGRMIVESAWGLGEAVVAGEVSPDNYVLDRESGDVDSVTVADKRVQYVRDPETGETVEEPVPDDEREARVLDATELSRLRELGERVEDHYGTPQDVEWAILADADPAASPAGVDAEDGLDGGAVYVLQSRPITTIGGETPESSLLEDAGETDQSRTAVDGGPTADPPESATDGSGQVDHASDAGGADDDLLLTGLGASPGRAGGAARIVGKLDELDKVDEGDVIVTAMTTPDMVPAMQRAAAIVTDQGGMTSHASIVSRELGVPAIVGAGSATATIEDGQAITVDGETGRVTAGAAAATDRGGSTEPARAAGGPDETAEPTAEATPPATATEVKVNVSIPEAAERAAATGADGVGLLRMEHVVLSLGETPEHYLETHGERAFVDELVEGIRTVADAFYPRPVRVRTLDAPTDEFRDLEGGDDEPVEHNPMLGYRGIRRSLDRPETFRAELAAIAKCLEMGYDNVEVMLPLVTDGDDVRAAREHMVEAGIDPTERTWGVMVETPASALCVDGMIDQGVDFVSFGTNDLTQYTLAVDRNNERVADRFDELHPAVLELLGGVIETCREHDVATSICGQAGSKPEMVRFLADAGVTSISANVDAVRDVQREVERVEQRLLLESVRESRD